MAASIGKDYCIASTWVVWGLDELLRGASPFRRLLGGLALAWQLAGLR